MEEKFDYNEAVKELESIAELVESPSTGVADVDKYLKRAETLINNCRAYLRTTREKITNFE